MTNGRLEFSLNIHLWIRHKSGMIENSIKKYENLYEL